MDRSFANQLDVPDDHAAIREGVRAVVSRFDDEYWLARDLMVAMGYEKWENFEKVPVATVTLLKKAWAASMSVTATVQPFRPSSPNGCSSLQYDAGRMGPPAGVPDEPTDPHQVRLSITRPGP